jgi:hypothetical protein
MGEVSADPFMRERAEEFAARCIVERNSDYTLRLLDDGGVDQTVDYLVLAECGVIELGVLEVGRNTSESARRDEDAHERHTAGPRRIAGLRRSWHIGIDSDRARFRSLLRSLSPLLLEAESLSRWKISTWSAHGYGADAQTLEWRLARLGVRSVTALEPAGEPAVWIAPMYGWSAGANPDSAVDEVEAWLGSGSDDQLGIGRKLLTRPDLPERHLFVWADRQKMSAAYALGRGELPSRAPQLPAQVTHLWLAAESAVSGCGGWAWAAVSGWRPLADVERIVNEAYARYAKSVDAATRQN